VCVILAIGDDDRFLLIKPSLRIAVELAVAVVAVAIAGTELVTIDLTSEDEAGMGEGEGGWRKVLILLYRVAWHAWNLEV